MQNKRECSPLQNILSWLVIAAIPVGVIVYFYVIDKSNRVSEEKGIKKIELREKSMAEIKKQLAEKYQAIDNLEEGSIYTIEAQKRLSSGKPVFFEVYMDDVFNRNSKVYARFVSPEQSLEMRFILELECNEQVLSKIMSHKPKEHWGRGFSKFAVVANIQEVIKPVYMLKAAPGAPAAPTVDDLEITIDGLENPFIVRGNCIDLAFLED